MVRMVSLLLISVPLIAVALVGGGFLGFDFVGTLVVICLITGFAVAAAGWTVHHNIR